MLSPVYYAVGEDVITFVPTPDWDDVVIVYSEDGLLEVTDHGVGGTVAGSTKQGTLLGDLTLQRLAPDATRTTTSTCAGNAVLRHKR